MYRWHTAGALSLFAVALALGASGCRKAAPPPPAPSSPAWFEDVTDKLGVDFVHDAGPLDGTYPLPQTTGSGAALFDCDGKGRLALYLLNNGGPKGRPNQLYLRQPGGTFANASKGSGLDFADYCMGAAVGDVNNDGLPDLLVTAVGGARLFLNLGGGKFKDVTKEAGLDNPAWGCSAAFLDYDRDGRLDLVVVNYVDFDPTWRCVAARGGKRDYCSPGVFPPTISRLFHNVSAKGGPVRFLDVTLPSGLAKAAGPGLGVVCADLTGDGWVDVLVANDGKPNHLWVNQHDGTFKEEAPQRGLAYDGMGRAQAGMGIGLADVDGDGLLDVFMAHLTEEQHTLWKQGPRGLFRDRSTQARLGSPGWRSTGFGTVLADFDNDGWPDLVIANGRAARGPAAPAGSPLGPHWGDYGERNQLFANDGAGRFKDVSGANPALCGRPNVARGLALGDIDGDGGLDLVVTTAGGRAVVLRNCAPRGHWLETRVLERSGTRDALGAEVVVEAGGREQILVAQTAGSYLSALQAAPHFGLGRADRYDGVRVLWPDGTRERFPGGPADRRVELRQGTGQPVAAGGKGGP
jgi:hypothetical protein